MFAHPAPAAAVVSIGELDWREAESLVASFGARLIEVRAGETIPGSYWGESEAGLVGNVVYVRADTPAHSLLHELSHYVCMDDQRRAALAKDAGGDDEEECAVCYLQVLLAQRLRGFGAACCIRDMDAWGYSFREGSARAWLEGDSKFARNWLLVHRLIDELEQPTMQLRRSARIVTEL